MRKMRHTLAMLLALAMLLTGISYQPAISNAAAKPKLSNKSITITVGKSKKITVKKATKYKRTWSVKSKKIAKIKKSGKYAVKVTGKKAGSTTVTCTLKKGKTKKKLTCKVKVKKKSTSTSVSSTPAPVAPTAKPADQATPATATPTVKPTATPVPAPTADPNFTPVTFHSASFDSGTDGFVGRGAAKVASVSGGKSGNCLSVTGRTYNWNGASLDITQDIAKKAVYQVSAWVKQDSGSDQTIKATCQIGSNSYDTVGTVETKSGEWTKFESMYVTPRSLDSILIYFEATDATLSFKVDEFKMVQVSEGIIPIDPMSLPNLKDSLSAFGNVGSCLTIGQLQNENTMTLFTKHYNSFTLENEMKPDNVLGYTATTITPEVAKEAPNNYVIPSGYSESTVPKLNFNDVDKALEIAKEKGLRMRAHTLLWHQQTRTWFFKQGYSDSNSKVTADVMTKRLEFYVKTVMKHVMDKEKELMGMNGTLVYAWDVVNEYTNRTNDPTSPSWMDVYGNQGLDPSYVKNAYKYAHEMLKQYGVEDSVKLFYNDYNTYVNTREVVTLIQNINKDGNICQGIGMQSHLDVGYPKLDGIASTIDEFAKLDVEIQITELDVTINYERGNSNYMGYKDADQAEYMGKLMTMLRQKKESGVDITGITFWGLYDSVSWRGTYSPLLFGAGFDDPKESFYAVINAMK